MATIRCDLLLLWFISCCVISAPMVFSDLVISKVDRRIDLTSQIVRSFTTLKVENDGANSVSEILLPLPDHQAKNLAFLIAIVTEEKGKSKSYSDVLSVKVSNPDGMPPSLTWYSVSLPKELGKGERLSLEIRAAFTHALRPFPEKISQADAQLVLFQDSAYYLSPYAVKGQSLTIKLPQPVRVESYTKLENTKLTESELKYGPYENLPAFSYRPIMAHFMSNGPFAVAQELVREIEVSHWGSVQITEHYNLIHAGAQSTGEFSRLDYQARPHLRGASAFRHCIARLPPRAHSVYYRDEIGNISTSSLWGDATKTILEIEPRYPMFGGWRTAFTIGYGLPLHDFLFQSQGKRFLNISFGSPINDLVIENLIVKVVLPEGSKDISVSTPFPVKESQEVKFSHLDLVGRPVVVLEKPNVVPEHNQYFQVYYRFGNLSLFREPLMLISGFFFFFVACIIYMRSDLTISKSSPSYLAKLQWDEVQSVVQQVQGIINECLAIHDKMETSLRDLSRTGEVQPCKAVRKAADSSLKELSKDLKPLLSFLQSSGQAAHILPKVDELIGKEKELQEKLLLKHSTVVESFERKSGGKDADSRVATLQQKITALRQEVDDLLELLDEI
ncbi:OLC1v1016031C2 [Oldenlandia corymbosa var. corymbosa]|uniref:Dolichyl-diphosphooligosaccharide--protein glycosyltransferase subunit 1 n=1 Tax=Oldenlandia corymbosa var. corymbosa TaxID=529605 RepID=A0AAV1E6M0_OLDCO|nr:OLC1v1016031C2 [Oldenlandia corymbosa var. corymbosa]